VARSSNFSEEAGKPCGRGPRDLGFWSWSAVLKKTRTSDMGELYIAVGRSPCLPLGTDWEEEDRERNTIEGSAWVF
jgi:hypothetical protein